MTLEELLNSVKRPSGHVSHFNKEKTSHSTDEMATGTPESGLRQFRLGQVNGPHNRIHTHRYTMPQESIPIHRLT